MRQTQTTRWLATAALAGLAALALAAGLAGLGGGRLPLFRQVVALGPGHALVLENDHFCFPEAPLAACRTGARRELRAWLYARGARHEIITHVWQR